MHRVRAKGQGSMMRIKPFLFSFICMSILFIGFFKSGQSYTTLVLMFHCVRIPTPYIILYNYYKVKKSPACGYNIQHCIIASGYVILSIRLNGPRHK